MNPIYFDHNATTPVHPKVLDAMLPYLKDGYANPSSAFKMGQDVRKAVEEARATMAKFIGADDPNEIVFTSGATESNNMAIKGIVEANANKGKRVVTSSIEHSSVRNVLIHLAEAGKIDNVPTPVSKEGLVDPKEVADAISKDTVLVTVMMVNNEVGTIQPIKEISKKTKEKDVPFLVDAAQSAGKIKINVNELGADLLSLSAHKFGGPKGIGLLYIRKGTKLESLIHGGTHEKNRRGGTENVPGIIGMSKAAEIAMAEMVEKDKKVGALRDLLEEKVLKEIPNTFVNGKKDNRVSNTSNITFEYTDSSALLMSLDLKGIACSTGSACASGIAEASHVLLAMGLPQDKAHAAIRFSLGTSNTQEEIEKAVSLIKDAVAKIRETHPLWEEAVNQ